MYASRPLYLPCRFSPSNNSGTVAHGGGLQNVVVVVCRMSNLTIPVMNAVGDGDMGCIPCSQRSQHGEAYMLWWHSLNSAQGLWIAWGRLLHSD